MDYRAIFREFLRYTLGIGPVIGGVLTVAAFVWTDLPRQLIGLLLMAPGLLIAPFLFVADTSFSTIDEGAEAGFISDDPNDHGVRSLSFPGRVQAGFLLFGLSLVGLFVFLFF